MNAVVDTTKAEGQDNNTTQVYLGELALISFKKKDDVANNNFLKDHLSFLSDGSVTEDEEHKFFYLPIASLGYFMHMLYVNTSDPNAVVTSEFNGIYSVDDDGKMINEQMITISETTPQ